MATKYYQILPTYQPSPPVYFARKIRQVVLVSEQNPSTIGIPGTADSNFIVSSKIVFIKRHLKFIKQGTGI